MTTTTTPDAPKKEKKTVPKDSKEYLMAPADFRKKVLRPLVVETRRIVNAAIDVGVAKNSVSEAAEGRDMCKETTANLRKLVHDHLRRLLNLSQYHRRVYALSGKKAQRLLNGEASSRANKPARTLAPYDPQFVSFLRDAADSHESLRFFKNFSLFDSTSPLSGMSTQIMISQFLLCYAAVHQRFNPENRQFIQPNDPMLKQLSSGIKAALDRQRVKIPALSAKYDQQLRFPYVQTLISHYRRPPPSEEARTAVKKMANDVGVVSTLRRENETLSSARKRIWTELRDNLPKKEKKENPKVSKAKAAAKNAKKAATKAATAVADAVAAAH